MAENVLSIWILAMALSPCGTQRLMHLSPPRCEEGLQQGWILHSCLLQQASAPTSSKT
jgi:hypothetical protein